MFCTRCGSKIMSRPCPVCGHGGTPALAGGQAPTKLTSYGGFWIRAGAILIDSTALNVVNPVIGFFAGVVGVILTAVLTGGTAADETSLVIGKIFWISISIIVSWVYFASFESSSIRGTPNKWLFGLTVSVSNSRRISFRRANLRYWSKILSALVMGIGFVMAAFSDKKQALHDRLAETYVLKERHVSSGAKLGYCAAAVVVLTSAKGLE